MALVVKVLTKNQHGIFCTTCLKWYHRKCKGASLKDYESLRNEDDDIPWQCMLCLIDDNASKFPFGYLSSMELNDFNGLDLPSQLKLLPSYQLRSKLSGIRILILKKIISGQLNQITMICMILSS